MFEKRLHKGFTSRLGTQDDDVQDRTSTTRETQEKRIGTVMWEMRSAGHRQYNRHKSKLKTTTNNRQNTSSTMYKDNDDDGDDDDFADDDDGV